MLKIKSLKIYLDVIHNIINEDLIDLRFIENVKLICQCALLGSSHCNEEQEKDLPQTIKNNWVYILMWISKDICLRQEDTRSIKNAVRSIETKVLNIFDKITCYRLNLQIRQFLVKFRRFQENSLDPDVEQEQQLHDLEQEFEELFKIQQYDIDIKITEMYLKLTNPDNVEEFQRSMGGKRRKMSASNIQAHLKELRDEMMRKSTPLDKLFLNYIIDTSTSLEVRQKALEVLIRNFNQRDILIKELCRTEILVNFDQYQEHQEFLSNLRQLKQQQNYLMRNEMYSHMLGHQGQSSKPIKDKVVVIIQNMNKTMRNTDPLTRRRF